MSDEILSQILGRLDRLNALIENAGGSLPAENDMSVSSVFVWQPERKYLQPVRDVNRVELALLKGIDRLKSILFENTKRFASGYAANSALLWGARGMGKSSLVKAVHAELSKSMDKLKLVEIHREDIGSLPHLLNILRDDNNRFILYCDDLSFDHDDTSYKSLKAALDGGVEGRPDNVIFYATSNRRHLLPRDMIENERSTAINPSEAIEEKVSLSDRFGLWLGFHKCNQDEYLEMVFSYAAHFDLGIDDAQLRHQALEWATTRGSQVRPRSMAVHPGTGWLPKEKHRLTFDRRWS